MEPPRAVLRPWTLEHGGSMTREGAVVGFAVAWILSVGAAPPAGGAEGPEPRALLGPELMLLSRPEVQADLGLDAKQAQRIDALSAGFQADAGREKGSGTASSPDAAIEDLDQEVAAYNRELAALLTPAQRQRVREIQIQMVGYVALLEPPIQKRLGLDASEIEKIDVVAREHVAEVKGLRRQLALGKVTPEAFREQVAALGRELDLRLGQVVAQDTRTKLAALGGKPFAGLPR